MTMKNTFFFFILFSFLTAYMQHVGAISHTLKTTPEQLKAIDLSQQPVCVTVHASWCRYCTTFLPNFYQAAQYFDNNARFYTLEIKEFHPEDPVYAYLQVELGTTLKVVPTVFVIQNKKVLEIIEGSMGYQQFIEKISPHIPIQEKRSMKKRLTKMKVNL